MSLMITDAIKHWNQDCRTRSASKMIVTHPEQFWIWSIYYCLYEYGHH